MYSSVLFEWRRQKEIRVSNITNIIFYMRFTHLDSQNVHFPLYCFQFNLFKYFSKTLSTNLLFFLSTVCGEIKMKWFDYICVYVLQNISLEWNPKWNVDFTNWFVYREDKIIIKILSALPTTSWIVQNEFNHLYTFNLRRINTHFQFYTINRFSAET